MTVGIALISMLAAYGITFAAGGSSTVFPHLFYIPVLIVALRWGAIAGITTGFVAGILGGPFMPLDVDAGLVQLPSHWLTRMAFFIGIGLLSGVLVERMQRQHKQVERFHTDAIRAFVRTIDAKSPYTAQHSERVARYAVLGTNALGLSQVMREHVHWAALVHDIGKLRIPDAVLNKEGPLTADEWEQIKRHPVYSTDLLWDVEEFRPYFPTIRGHHERYDGNGYPDGLKGDEIPFPARILTVADSFEAMTAERPYRRPLSYQEAVTELQANAGVQFDPTVVDAFCRALENELPDPNRISQTIG